MSRPFPLPTLAALLLLSACELNFREDLDADVPAPAPDSGRDAALGSPDASDPSSDSGATASPDAASAEPDAGSSSPDASALPASPRFIGRHDPSARTQPHFGFSGSAIEARFMGTGITLKLEDSNLDEYSVLVDGAKSVLATDSQQQAYPLAQNLPAGEHHILVWKNTEWFQGEGDFLGFDLDGGGSYLPLSPPSRRLEFVGDSITCAYGNLGADQWCSFSPETEDHYQGYAAIAARALGADQSTVCQSGIGVYRNYDGATDHTMIGLYPFSSGQGPEWDFSLFVPDAILVNLGTNDFAKGTPDKAAFETAYSQLLDFIRTRNPNAFILLAVGPMLGATEAATLKGWLDELAAARAGAGDAKVSVVEFAMQDGSLGYGCDWHPSAATHQQMADHLVPVLKGLLGW